MELVSTKKHQLSLIDFSIGLLIVMSIVNTAKYGATLSWVLLPCCIIVIYRICQGFDTIRVKHNNWVVVFLWLTIAVSTFFSAYIEVQSSIATFLIWSIVYFVVTSKDYSWKSVRFFLGVYIATATFCSLNIIVNYFQGSLYNEWQQRTSMIILGVAKDPNYVTAYIVSSLCLLSQMLVYGEKKKAGLYIILFFIQIMSCFLSGSRASLVVTILCLGITIFFAVMKKRISLPKIFFWVSVFAVLVIIAMLVFPEKLMERFFDFEAYGEDSRLEIWAIAWKFFKQHIFFGAGMNSTSLYTATIEGHHTHNIYVELLGDFGLIGTFVFMVFIVATMKVRKKDVYFMLPLFLAGFLPMFFINGFNTTAFWLPCILCSIISIKSYETENEIAPILLENMREIGA